MKLLSFAVPCYNSAAYMSKCIDSLLPGGEDVEIIIVNDGSHDDTIKIAQEYREKYPNIIKVIDKENGGHGSGVNAGIANASGLYYKVVDSDDCVDLDAYMEILETLKNLLRDGKTVDMFLSNFVYDKVGAKHKKVMKYTRILPVGEVFTWKDVKHFPVGKYILMHSVIYRTNLLKECGLKLPEHTFYVDNIFVFNPLPYVKTMYYLDVTFYKYYIGREDQSVNEEIMIKRIDQQIKVNKLMVDYFVSEKKRIFSNGKVRKYMANYLDIITTVSSILLIRSGTEENLEKKKELWNYIKTKDAGVWRRLRFGFLGTVMNLPGRGGRRLSVDGYKLSQKIFHFN